MATKTIDQNLIAFKDLLEKRVEDGFRLSPFFDYVQLKSKRDEFIYDGLSLVDVQTNKDHELFRYEHNKRKIPQTLQRAYTIDEARLATDHRDDYAEVLIKVIIGDLVPAFNRICCGALFADVQMVKGLGTPLTPAQDGVFSVDATGGLTHKNFIEIEQNFAINEIEIGNVPIAIGLSIDEERMLRDSRWIVGEGKEIYVVGMKVIVLNKSLLHNNAGECTCFALAKGGLCVGLSFEIDNEHSQIVCTMGAVRTEGKLVQKLVTIT